jgi:CO/xanthine dehydrogenase Mo-binding subunit
MALLLNMDTSSLGASFPQAYARIARVSGDKNTSMVQVEIHANQAARLLEARPIELRVHRLEMPHDVPLYPTLYGALKALPEYAGAVDVL